MTRRGYGPENMSDAELAQWGIARTPQPASAQEISGRASPQLQSTPTTLPGNTVAVFGANWDRALPRVLSLGAPAPCYDPVTSRFPPAEIGSYRAGLVGDDTWTSGVQGGRFAAAVLGYGVGASQHRAVFDWRPGTYALPPCDYVELSLIAYGAAWTAPAEFVASCVPGEWAHAHVPTVTGYSVWENPLETPLLQPASVAVPALARAVDVWSANGGASITITGDDGTPYMTRDSVGALPQGPVQVESGGSLYLDIAPGDTAWAIVKFYLAL